MFKNILALVIIAAFVSVIALWIVRPPAGSEGAMAVLNQLLGFLAAAFGAVVTYFFGSSSGSSDKDATIKTMIGTGDGLLKVSNSDVLATAKTDKQV